MKFRKSNEWDDMPKVTLLRWHGKRVQLVNWECLTVSEADGTPIAGMDLHLWWRVFAYL